MSSVVHTFLYEQHAADFSFSVLSPLYQCELVTSQGSGGRMALRWCTEPDMATRRVHRGAQPCLIYLCAIRFSRKRCYRLWKTYCATESYHPSLTGGPVTWKVRGTVTAVRVCIHPWFVNRITNETKTENRKMKRNETKRTKRNENMSLYNAVFRVARCLLTLLVTHRFKDSVCMLYRSSQPVRKRKANSDRAKIKPLKVFRSRGWICKNTFRNRNKGTTREP